MRSAARRDLPPSPYVAIFTIDVKADRREDFLAAMDKEDEACQGRTSQNVTRLGRRDEPGDMR